MKIPQEQISEWVDNPVTVAFRELVEGQKEDLETTGTDAYHPFEPYKTQEIIASINGSVDALDLILEALTGEWTFMSPIEEDEDGE